jgi:LmbE family N-acetylglucosaminyl deacetylase
MNDPDFPAAEQARYDAIYISPHLDDAVLSCGGQIYQQTRAGQSVLIVTVAAGGPQSGVVSFFAEFQHYSWGLSGAEAMKARRVEDARAAARLGAEAVIWSLPDAIYRLHPATGEPLYTDNDQLFGRLSPDETPLIAELAARLGSLPPAERIVAPLALGSHVDHQLVRAAAEDAFANLAYYEDYPYVQRHPQSLPVMLQPPESWQSILFPLDEAALVARIEAIAAYESQMKVLFSGPEAMAGLVRQQVARTGGERLWLRWSGR